MVFSSKDTIFIKNLVLLNGYLNPVDYRIWGLIQECVYQTAIWDIEELKERLIVVWAELKQRVVDKAIE